MEHLYLAHAWSRARNHPPNYGGEIVNYFRWEKNFAGQWIPALYTEKPIKSTNGNDPECGVIHETALKLRAASEKFPKPVEKES